MAEANKKREEFENLMADLPCFEQLHRYGAKRALSISYTTQPKPHHSGFHADFALVAQC